MSTVNIQGQDRELIFEEAYLTSKDVRIRQFDDQELETMRHLFSHVLVAVFTFALGTTATDIVNFSEDSLVEYAEDGLNFGAKFLPWQSSFPRFPGHARS
jgi:hypothetical protein